MCFARENSSQKEENALYLREEDFLEQFESVPMSTSLSSVIFSAMKFYKLAMQSRNSSPFPQVGK